MSCYEIKVFSSATDTLKGLESKVNDFLSGKETDGVIPDIQNIDYRVNEQDVFCFITIWNN